MIIGGAAADGRSRIGDGIRAAIRRGGLEGLLALFPGASPAYKARLLASDIKALEACRTDSLGFADILTSMTMPCLMYAGSADAVFPLVEETVAEMPNVAFFHLPGLRHSETNRGSDLGNATRDYLDLAALASHMGIDAAAKALGSMDELYPQNNGDPWAVRTQLVMQLAAPPPYDLQGDDLSEYKGVHSPFDQWSHVATMCGKLSDQLLNDCMEALRTDPSSAAQQAQTKIDTWRDARAAGNAAAREAAGAYDMKHRHLVHQQFTAAAIEDILDRGTMPDWAPLIEAIKTDPHGQVANVTLELCKRPREYPLFGAPVFLRVIADARQPKP